MIGTRPKCLDCKHLLKGPGLCCEAFPDGVPDEIIMGEDHTKPFPGDHGIRFEPR